MKKRVKWTSLIAIMLLAVVVFSGCSKKTGDTSSGESASAASEETKEEKKGLFDASFSAETTISYSAGNDSSWAYGNQRKEFPDGEPCYVRISSTMITDKKGGVDKEITVTYRFTGTEKCSVEISDGQAQKVDTNDANVTEYSMTLNAAKAKKAKESIVIFRYSPAGASQIALEVIYDDQVDAKYDTRNTIYFTKSTKPNNEAH